jgi:hypothetical protein
MQIEIYISPVWFEAINGLLIDIETIEEPL